MIVTLHKFGNLLNSRPLGREALAAFQSTLQNLNSTEEIEIDFDGVTTFSPSWGDEFIGTLLNKYNGRLVLKKSDNPSVQATLQLLEQIHGKKFKYAS